MIGKAWTYSRIGMYCLKVDVEVDIKNGLPIILVTGLLSQEVKEAKERVRPAILNSDLEFPMQRITINLAPAETIKLGTHYDLSIAVAILKAANLISQKERKEAFFGELNLSGEIKWVRGILPMVIEALKDNFEKIYIPIDNYEEVLFLQNDRIIPVSSIKDLLKKREESITYTSYSYREPQKTKNHKIDYSDIRGQSEMINAFKIAAAGKHHMLLVGPPGSGKTMAASRLITIMKEFTNEEKLEVNKIYSIASVSPKQQWINSRPFRSPHNSFSTRALIGGGPKVLPGEVSLAHKGILFLDEFLEFRTDALQALRTIIEKKEVYISLRNGCAIYPADFLLIAAANPCPCGFYGTKDGFCSCSLKEIKRYRRKLKNPLVDRIDLFVKVDRINYKNLAHGKTNKSSYEIKQEIEKAQEIQQNRFSKEKFKLNSQIPVDKIEYYCEVEKEGEKILEDYIEKHCLTARSYHKILRISRTIADLNSHSIIQKQDIESAIFYRFLDVENV